MRTAFLLALALTFAATGSSCAREMDPPPTPPEPPSLEDPFSPFVAVPPEDVPDLVESLRGPKAKETHALLTRTTAEAFPPLEEILATCDRDLTGRILRVLVEHMNPQASLPIRNLALKGRETWRRLEGLEALRAIARETGVDFLRPLGPLLAPDSENSIRMAALAILVEQPVPPLKRRLLSILTDPQDNVRKAANDALKALVERDPESASELARAIDEVKPERARLQLARVLSSVRNDAASRTIGLLLDSEDRTVRLEAVRALRKNGKAAPRPPSLFRRLLDPDDAVFRETLDLFAEVGEEKDVPEIAPFLERPGLGEDRRETVAKLLDRLAGTRFGTDPRRFREWSLRWMAGRPGDFENLEPSVVIPFETPAGGDGDRRPIPWMECLTAALLAVLAFTGLFASSPAGKKGKAQKDAVEETPGAESDIPPATSHLGRLGKWIFDHRILVLFPWFVPPFLLFEIDRLPSPGWRILIYSIALLGAGLRVWCTGYRTWAYRSSGERHLMTSGPYSVARHPIYQANFLLAIPIFLAVNLWPLTLAFSLWFAVTHLAIVVREDQVLKARYGEEWLDYASKVRRFLPRLTPFDPRRGEFSMEPVVKGMEIPKALALLLLLPLVLEGLASTWDSLAARLRDVMGFVS